MFCFHFSLTGLLFQIFSWLGPIRELLDNSYTGFYCRLDVLHSGDNSAIYFPSLADRLFCLFHLNGEVQNLPVHTNDFLFLNVS